MDVTSKNLKFSRLRSRAVNEPSRSIPASPEVGQLAADDVEDGEDGLGEGGGVLRARGVAQLQLGQVTQPGHRRQHHQVQVAVVEAELSL